MDTWERYFNRGKDSLSRHNPEQALKDLQIAIESCSPEEHSKLAKVLFYTGITLKKLGVPNGAAKSWIVAQKLKKSGKCTKMIKRFVNQYGMEKQSNPHLDDWKAFEAIQIKRYLDRKKVRYFVTEAERDMIEKLISDHWKDMTSKVTLEVLGKEEKLKLFRDLRIIFPYFDIPEDFEEAKEIRVDFSNKRRIRPNDRCFCGSGIKYSQCCGRTLGMDELLSGSK
jgi:hypothetical protein